MIKELFGFVGDVSTKVCIAQIESLVKPNTIKLNPILLEARSGCCSKRGSVCGCNTLIAMDPIVQLVGTRMSDFEKFPRYPDTHYEEISIKLQVMEKAALDRYNDLASTLRCIILLQCVIGVFLAWLVW